MAKVEDKALKKKHSRLQPTTKHATLSISRSLEVEVLLVENYDSPQCHLVEVLSSQRIDF